MAKNRSPLDGKRRSLTKRTVTDGPFAETKELAGFWQERDEGMYEGDSELEVVSSGEFRSPNGLPE